MYIKCRNAQGENNMQPIMKGILDSFKMLGIVLGLIGGTYLLLFVITLVLGVVYNLALGGTINVSTATLTLMNNSFTSFSTLVTVVNGALTFTGSLLTVAIVLIVFGGLFAFGSQAVKKTKQGKSNAFFDEGKNY